jgi:hypothetical protein
MKQLKLDENFVEMRLDSIPPFDVNCHTYTPERERDNTRMK